MDSWTNERPIGAPQRLSALQRASCGSARRAATASSDVAAPRLRIEEGAFIVSPGKFPTRSGLDELTVRLQQRNMAP